MGIEDYDFFVLDYMLPPYTADDLKGMIDKIQTPYVLHTSMDPKQIQNFPDELIYSKSGGSIFKLPEIIRNMIKPKNPELSLKTS